MLATCMFSCLGHHAIGLGRADIETWTFCENKVWRQERIAERFPGAIIFNDAKTMPVKATFGGVLVGGPPCQKTSVASAIHGKRSGESLWPAMRRHVLAHEWTVVEQPPGHAAWENEVAHDLAEDGRHVARIEFAACDVGAPYLRRRVFLVACPSLSRLQVAWRAVPSAIAAVKRAADARGDWDPDKLTAIPVDARSAGEFDRGPLSAERTLLIEALGDSNPPHMMEVIGRAIMAASE